MHFVSRKVSWKSGVRIASNAVAVPMSAAVYAINTL